MELGPVQGALEDVSEWRIKGELCYRTNVDEGRKRVLLIAAAILAARKLSQLDPAKRVPATVAAITDAVHWAERLLEEIDQRWPSPK